ncbi:MoaD/ThiS family protein [Tepidibacillus sp. HK-1]|uniref:MoaD/ThiS family protein n=1 Tax=Tepidibacillus sp. HK-1 TaxID=1883407 RepID=UPI000852B48F|nr:MoaD/ThiS family protein [Tepidibacillus sp. HK-1]GBF12230.1 hypothetical protein HK1_02291 [Tepidibacillus sp. HK-1]
MTVKVKSNIPYLKHFNGEHMIDENITVKEFLQAHGVKWDNDALVILNETFSKGTEILKDKDMIKLLIPIAGG